MNKVLVYPKDSNPYQDLLYSNIKEFQITYLSDPTASHTLNLIALPMQLFKYRIDGYKIFHLHWVYKFQSQYITNTAITFILQLMNSLYFMFFLLLIKMLRFKLLWTIHDYIPHEKTFVNDYFMSKVLYYFCDITIVHSKHTKMEIENIHGNGKKCIIIPIGNYIDIYSNVYSTDQSKKIVGIKTDKFVYGFMGNIEEYKGIYDLVNGFNMLNDKDSILLIAGRCKDEKIKHFLNKCSTENINIVLNLSYISNERIENYIKCIDIFVYPFKNITTSSSLILAMSYKKPFISTLLGDIYDLPKGSGYFYQDRGDLNILVDLLRLSKKERRDLIHKGEIGYKYIFNKSWQNSSKLTSDTYKLLLDS